MGLTERERESTGVLHGIVSQIMPGEKYARLEEENEGMEMKHFPQAETPKQKYSKVSQGDEITPYEESEETHGIGEERKVEVVIGEERGKEVRNEEEEEEEAQAQSAISQWINGLIERHTQKIAWGCTVAGMLCVGWIGPCFKLLGSEGVAAGRRASWRSQALLILLLIPTIIEYRSLTRRQKRELFNKYTIFQLVLTSTFWFSDLFLWSNSLDYTTVSRSSIFANTASIMIMVWSIVRRKPISWMEILGGVIGFLGLVFAVVGTNLFFASEAEQHAKNPLKGDILAIIAAACASGYIMNATKVRAKVSVFVYTTTNTVFLICTLSTASFIMEGTKFDTSTEGIFGWIDPKFMVVVGLLSVVAGMIGFNLNNVALRYISPLGYALVALCDPFVSGTYAWIIGADGVPGVFTFLGGLITISGIVVMILGQEKRTKREKLMEAEKLAPKVLEFVVSDGRKEA